MVEFQEEGGEPWIDQEEEGGCTLHLSHRNSMYITCDLSSVPNVS